MHTQHDHLVGLFFVVDRLEYVNIVYGSHSLHMRSDFFFPNFD